MRKAVASLLSDDERLLATLQGVGKSQDARTRHQAHSLMLWYMRHKEWTGAQRRLVRLLCRHASVNG